MSNTIFSNKIAEIKANLKAELKFKEQQRNLADEVWGTSCNDTIAIDRIINIATKQMEG